jgi:hypothetical protein
MFPLQIPFANGPVLVGEIGICVPLPLRMVSKEKPVKDLMATPPGNPVTLLQLSVFNNVEPSES